jgi:SAM-dependent methyltransferase
VRKVRDDSVGSHPAFGGSDRRGEDLLAWGILACPHCEGILEPCAAGASCSGCERVFPRTKPGALDLRLQSEKIVTVDFVVGEQPLGGGGLPLADHDMNNEPEVDFRGVPTPYHLDREMMSYFPRPRSDRSLALDLGCGEAIHRQVCEHAGFDYVGLDIQAPGASILGDAHALPFRNEAFEFILSIAVLEHIRYPFVALSEAHRVLKRGGTLLGTVGFLEPFHDDSYYHHTHLGVVNTLRAAGFDVRRVAPSATWNVLVAQVEMGLFPRMPHRLARALVRPLDVTQRAWRRFAQRVSSSLSPTDVVARTTGAFFFVAKKPFLSALLLFGSIEPV